MGNASVKQIKFSVFALVGVLSISLPCAAMPFDYQSLTPKACETILKSGAQIFVGPDVNISEVSIRGREIEKILNALETRAPAQLADLQKLGIRFGRDATLIVSNDADAETVYFNKASFYGVKLFFAIVKGFAKTGAGENEQPVVSRNVIDALESSLMQKIGAIAYGETAQTIHELYNEEQKRGPNVGPLPFQMYGDVIDFTGTNAQQLENIIEIVERGATEKQNEKALNRWAQTARGFLLEAKRRDD